MEQRKFRTDPLTIRRLRITGGLTVKEFRKVTDLDKSTTSKILRGEPVFLSSLSQAMLKAFNIDDPLKVLHPDELAALGVKTEVTSADEVLEWKIEDYCSGWEKTSNGLQFQVVRLRHRYLDGRIARGKCYELRHLSVPERERIEAYLHRHADVCERIGTHSNVAQNLTAALVGGLWWVIDRWEEGETLEQRLSSGPLGEYELRFIMTGIATGLAALHDTDIIRRELSPRSVVLRASSDRPLLTDMELAKLASGGPTVSPEEWPDDPYRALEVNGDTPFDVRADVYSWGRIFVHGANGILPDRGTETLPVGDMIPNIVRDAVMQSVEPLPSRRPPDIHTVLNAMKVWE